MQFVELSFSVSQFAVFPRLDLVVYTEGMIHIHKVIKKKKKSRGIIWSCYFPSAPHFNEHTWNNNGSCSCLPASPQTDTPAGLLIAGKFLCLQNISQGSDTPEALFPTKEAQDF